MIRRGVAAFIAFEVRHASDNGVGRQYLAFFHCFKMAPAQCRLFDDFVSLGIFVIAKDTI